MMITVALLAMGVLVSTFTYEAVGLTASIERLTDATRQASALALQRPSPPKPAPVRPMDPSPPSPTFRTTAFAPLIVPESDNEYVVDRRFLDLALEEQASLMRSVRVVPAMENGKTYARLYGVRPYSLLDLLGFRDGDALESINGFDLSTPERALEAYARLRTADYLEARVRRAGRIVTLRYRIW
ncbi:MAG TPA: hypothetical protein VF765_00600 [Polyangiaceae bacterium]